MSIPTLTPTSTKSAVVLPATGSASDVLAALPLSAYTSSAFTAGAAAQVAYTYKKLGGDLLDIELKADNVYANYEEACLEYSYIVNIHQSKNTLGAALGAPTASFDHKGKVTTGTQNIALKYPKFSFETAFRLADAYSTEAMVGGRKEVYSASIAMVNQKQDYDLQAIVESAALTGSSPFNNKINNKRIKVHQVYYVSPRQMWRFYGYYGGLNVVGDFQNYGQYADDSSFQVIPSWQNKIQAISYEDHLYTRTSHYSYEIINNKLKLFPTPVAGAMPDHFWFRFSVDDSDIWSDTEEGGQNGVNNMNTIPFENIPYANINSIGKQWIRRFCLALSKETLGQIRGKFGGVIPIPGDNINLNASDLLSQAKEEQTALREELKTQLDEMTYNKLLETDASMSENAQKMVENVPLKIFVG
tara:strand:- start:22 stop:1269 length:1248 start_codon:yes stop_codon:yes gene_type:complete